MRHLDLKKSFSISAVAAVAVSVLFAAVLISCGVSGGGRSNVATGAPAEPAPPSVLQPAQSSEDDSQADETESGDGEPTLISEPERPKIITDLDGPIRFGIDAQYPPANFVNDDGEIDGFEPEMRDELCRRSQLECVWVENEWVSLIPNLLDGKFDVILTLMYNTAERDEIIDFSQPYEPAIPSGYAARSGSADDVINGVVAAISKTVQASYIENQTSATLVTYDTQQETVEAVLNGDADALLNDKGSLRKIVADSGGVLEIVGEDVEFPDLGSSMGFRPEDAALRAKLDTAVSSMKSDGSLNAMILKWYREDARLFPDPMSADRPAG